MVVESLLAVCRMRVSDVLRTVTYLSPDGDQGRTPVFFFLSKRYRICVFVLFPLALSLFVPSPPPCTPSPPLFICSHRPFIRALLSFSLIFISETALSRLLPRDIPLQPHTTMPHLPLPHHISIVYRSNASHELRHSSSHQPIPLCGTLAFYFSSSFQSHINLD